MSARVFFSWQSYTKAAACRTFVSTSLKAALADLFADGTVEEAARIDHDTLEVPGAPDIGATILEKIEVCSAFVADVTIVTPTGFARPSPNPNVLLELGYALHALGDARIVLVQNTAFGPPEQLPFDLRQKRVLTYCSPEDALTRAEERRSLQSKLKAALSPILTAEKSKTVPVTLTMTHARTGGNGECHQYNLWTHIENRGDVRLNDWEIELNFPTALLDSTVHGLRVAEGSGAERTVFRLNNDHKGPLRPQDKHSFSVGYTVNRDVFWNKKHLLQAQVQASASVDGSIVARVAESMENLQNF